MDGMLDGEGLDLNETADRLEELAEEEEELAYGRELGGLVKELATQTAKQVVEQALASHVQPPLSAVDHAAIAATARGAARVTVAEDIGAAITALESAFAKTVAGLREELSALGNEALSRAQGAGQLAQSVQGSATDSMQAAVDALGAAQAVQQSVAAIEATVAELTARLDTPPEALPNGAYPIKAFYGPWDKAKSYSVGSQVTHNGATWLAIAAVPASDQSEPGVMSKLWSQTGLMFAGFVGAGSGRAARALASVPPFFTTDTTPDPAPGNAATFGGLSTQHIRGWIDTSTMQNFVAVQNDGGGWIWVKAGGAP